MREVGVCCPEDKADGAKKANWARRGVMSTHWRSWRCGSADARPKPLEYYDAWYHAALALKDEGKTTEAKQTLASVMRLSATVGGPEMKAEVRRALLDQIK